MDYSNDGEAIDQKFLQTGKTLGSTLDIGYDFAVKKHLALGISLSGVSGTLYQVQEEINGVVTTYDLDAENLMGVATYHFGASLKYNF